MVMQREQTFSPGLCKASSASPAAMPGGVISTARAPDSFSVRMWRRRRERFLFLLPESRFVLELEWGWIFAVPHATDVGEDGGVAGWKWNEGREEPRSTA